MGLVWKSCIPASKQVVSFVPAIANAPVKTRMKKPILHKYRRRDAHLEYIGCRILNTVKPVRWDLILLRRALRNEGQGQ